MSNTLKNEALVLQFLPFLSGCLFITLSWKHIHCNVILGSFRDMLPAKLANEKSNQEKSQKASEGEEQGRETKGKSVKKRKQMGESAEDGEQPGPSRPQTPPQRRTKRNISYCEYFNAIIS